MVLTIPVSSDIANGVAGVLMMMCVLPILERARVLAVNHADRHDVGRTGYIRVGSRMQLLGRTTKRHGNIALKILAISVVICTIVGELMLPFSVKGTSKPRDKEVSASGSQLVNLATYRRGFNSTVPCLTLTYTAEGYEGVVFNRSFLKDGERKCERRSHFNLSFVMDRPMVEMAEPLSSVREMRKFTLGRQSIWMIPFQDGSMAGCVELMASGQGTSKCTLMRPLTNGTYQFWFYPNLSTSVVNLTSSTGRWATQQKTISRLALERNGAPLVSLLREIMNGIPRVVDLELNTTSESLSISGFALSMITLTSTAMLESKAKDLGTVIRNFFTDRPGSFTFTSTEDVTEFNEALLAPSLSLTFLPSLLFLLIVYLRTTGCSLKIDSGCPNYLAALTVPQEAFRKCENPGEVFGDVIIKYEDGNLHLDIAGSTSTGVGRQRIIRASLE
jgi:hypothetical protein